MTRKIISALVLLILSIAIFMVGDSSAKAATTNHFTLPLDGLTKSTGYSGFIPNRVISESSNTVAHLACDYVSSTGNWNVMSIYPGTVYAVRTTLSDDAGRYVCVKHNISGITVYSFYQHLKSVSVAVGQSVSGGDIIGIAGQTGTTETQYDRHLHLSVFSGTYDWSKPRQTQYGKNVEENGPIPIDGTTYYNPQRLFDGSCSIGGVTGITKYHPVAYENCVYEITKDAQFHMEPLASSDKGHLVKAGTLVLSDAIVDNGTNYWVRITSIGTSKLAEPEYIFSGYSNTLVQNGNQYLKYVSTNPWITWENNNIEGITHTQGKSLALNGQITSKATIKSITAQLYHSGSKWGDPYTVSVNSQSYSMYGSAIDMNMKFGSLSAGNCRLDLKVEYYTNRMSTATYTIQTNFTVGSGSSAAASTLKITGVKYPSTYMYNNGGYGYVVDSGTVSSNYALTKITTDIQNSSGKSITTGLPKTVTPSGTSYSISALNSVLPFSKINSAGTYYWIITATDSSGKSVTLKMPINAVASGSNTIATGTTETTAVTGVSVDLDEVTLRIGQTTKLTAMVSPSNATNKSVTWKSSNTAVATVSNGTITAKAGGTATITCTTADGGYTASCKVTVTTSVTGISLSPTTLTLEWGKTSSLTATISPTNATNKTVHWSTSNSSVATVDNGVVKGVSAGTATITAMAEDGGYKATCAVTVKVPPTGVKLNASSTTLNVGNTTMLTATVSPSNATNKSVTWTSSNTSVATVSSSGVVTAKATGKVTISCKTADGGYTASCTVYVVNPVNLGDDFYAEIRHVGSGKIIDATNKEYASVTYRQKNNNESHVWHFTRLADGSYHIYKGEYYMELAGGYTDNNTDIRLYRYNNNSAQRWYIQKYSDGYRLTSQKLPSRCAQVTGNGTEDDGNVYLYDEGSTKAQCFAIDKVTLVESVTLDSSNISLYVNWTKTLTATVSPSTASNKSVIWSSDNTAVATVSSSGVVTGKSNGTATITCKTVDGSYTASCKVTVSTQVSGILLEPQVIALSPVNVRTGPSTSYEVITKLQTGDTLPYAGNKQADSDGTVWYNVTVNGKAGWMSSNLSEIQQNQTIIVDKGEHVTLQYFIEPADATNKNVTWSSSNTSVATVNAAQVAAVAPGKTTITCTTHNGGYSATCTVVVYGEKKLVLPADLKMIESEAFRQLAMDTVILSPNTESIGSKAFADCDDLSIIYMPDSVVQIAEDAFNGSGDVCFVCESENVAAAYAQKYSITYVVE